jgi:hypothetical protein
MEIKKHIDRFLLNILIPHQRHPIRTIAPFLAGLLWVAIFGNLVFSLLSWLELRWRGDSPPPPHPPWLLALGVCLGGILILLLWSLLAQTRTLVTKPSPPEEAPPPAMKGLVILLSFYSPRGGGTTFDDFAAMLNFPNKTEDEWKELEEAAEKSNFDVPLQAIRYHMRNGSLRHVWLICTDDAGDGLTLINEKKPTTPGSWRLAPFLEKFVHEAPHEKLAPAAGASFDHARRVQFHYHSEEQPKRECLVNFYGEQGARDVFKAVNFIFDKEVEVFGLEMEDVICDITGARAPHTVGMVVASLPAQRRIQYCSSPQTQEGRYTGRPTPMEIRADKSWKSWFVLRVVGDVGEGE